MTKRRKSSNPRYVILELQAEVVGEPLSDKLLYRLITRTAVGASSENVRGHPKTKVSVVGAEMRIMTPETFPMMTTVIRAIAPKKSRSRTCQDRKSVV